MPAATKKLQIDFPKPDERIASKSYTFRFSAELDPGDRVVVSLDDAADQPCRLDAGYWWFDWHSGRPGQHRVTAKVVTSGGSVAGQAERRFIVEAVEPHASEHANCEPDCTPISEDNA